MEDISTPYIRKQQQLRSWFRRMVRWAYVSSNTKDTNIVSSTDGDRIAVSQSVRERERDDERQQSQSDRQ